MSFIKVPNILFDYYEMENESISGRQQKPQRIKYYDLEAVDLRVYVYFLASGGFVNQKRIIRKYKTIAAHCGIKDSKTIHTSVSRLIDKGLITKCRRFNRWGHFAANGYRTVSLPGGYFKFNAEYFKHEMTVPEMCVLLYLNRCRNMDDPRFACPSMSKMCLALNLAKGTVRKSINSLEQRFYIQKNHYISKDGDYGNNRYRLYTLSERNDLLRPYRKIKRKLTTVIMTVVKCVKKIVLTVGKFLAKYIFDRFFKNTGVGQSFPNTS